MPKTAVFGPKAHAPLSKHNIQENFFFRLVTAENFVHGAGLVNEDWLQLLDALQLVDGVHQNGRDIIFHHDPVNIPAPYIILNLTSHTIQACFGNRCEGTFRDFGAN